MKKCELCDGEGKIEGQTITCDSDTGFNTIVEGNGKFYPCPECGELEEEMSEL